ncbi:MAG: DUF4878 domain-containing protein [Neisseriaceae bacterium]|nr:DUF4878 domain-containing protein [Neisseriaceae bacterium]
MKFLQQKIFLFFYTIITVFLLTACLPNSPEKIAEKFMRAVYSGDSQTVIDMVYIEEENKNKVGMEEMLRGKLKIMVDDAHDKAQKRGGVKSVKSDKAEYSNNNQQAKVKVHVIFNQNNEEIIEDVKLIKDKKVWKINM